jgi:hypothetical protein
MINNLEEYGVDEQFLSAFYGMWGKICKLTK